MRLARRPPSGWRWWRCQGGGTRSGATTRSAREDAVSEVRRRVGDEARHVRVEVWASSSGAAALDRTPARGSTSAAELAHPLSSLLMTNVEGGIAEEGELRAMGCTLRGHEERERRRGESGEGTKGIEQRETQRLKSAAEKRRIRRRKRSPSLTTTRKHSTPARTRSPTPTRALIQREQHHHTCIPKTHNNTPHQERLLHQDTNKRTVEPILFHATCSRRTLPSCSNRRPVRRGLDLLAPRLSTPSPPSTPPETSDANEGACIASAPLLPR